MEFHLMPELGSGGKAVAPHLRSHRNGPRLARAFAARFTSVFVLLLLLAPSSLPWNTPNYQKQRGSIRVLGKTSPIGNLSYFADLDRTPGYVYHQSAHAYIIEHAIRLLREDGCPNWADFAQANLLHLISGAVHADAYKGRVMIRIQLEVLWGLFSEDLFEWDLTCAGGCEHYHNISDGSGLDLTGFSVLGNAADFLIKILTIYASWYSSGMGLVNLDVEVDPRLDFSYPSGATLCGQHYAQALATWRDGTLSYPARSQRESAMYELGWACHLLADLTVAQHLHEMFIGGHASYEDFAEGMGDEPDLHAVKGDFVKNFVGNIPPPQQLADNLARFMCLQHPENLDQAEDGGDAERRQALKVALPAAERYTAALMARFMKEIGVPKTAPPLRGYVSVKGKADKIPGAYVYYAPYNPIEQNVDFKDLWRGWSHVRADSQGMYSIPMTGSMRYLIRPVMPGYSFDGTTDANLEFGPKTCPVEYRQAPGVVDTDMLNLYMDPLPKKMVAVMMPKQKQAVLAKPLPPGLMVKERADIVPVGARLTRSGTGISKSLASAVTKSLLETECSMNVIGVRGNDIGLADEAGVNLRVFNYLDIAKGQVVVSAAGVREAVDNFRATWKAAGLPMTASGDLQTTLTGKETLKPLDVVGPGGLQALKEKLPARQITAPDKAKRNVFSFAPPGVDSLQSSLLMENGLALVPAPRGVEIEVSTLPAPGCLLAASAVRLTTNDEGLASFRVKAGSHAGKVRLQIKVVKNPAAPQILPSETVEIAVQPRLQGADPLTEAPVVLEPVFLMNTIQATLLTPGPAPAVFRTTIQVSPQGVAHGNMDLAPGFRPALRTAPVPATKAKIERIEPAAAQPRTPDISGTWQSSIGLVYEITQTGSAFTWHVASVNQRAEGTIEGNSVKASWRGLLRRDSATGKVILDASGRAVRIEWSNGVVFRR
jgi:hypothetical protein